MSLSGDADVCAGSELLLGPTANLAGAVRTRAPVIPGHVPPLQNTRVTRDQVSRPGRIIVTNVTHWILDGITQNILVPELRGLKLPDIKK